MRTYYRPLVADDLNEVFNLDLRQSDKNELKASAGLEPADAILLSLMYSVEKYVVVHNGKIEAVFGLSFIPDQLVAVPWFVGTDKLSEYKTTFLRQSKEVVNQWIQRYHCLLNFVDSRHTESINWLRWLGFTVDEKLPVTLSDPSVPFFPFYYPEEVGSYVRACLYYGINCGDSGCCDHLLTDTGSKQGSQSTGTGCKSSGGEGEDCPRDSEAAD